MPSKTRTLKSRIAAEPGHAGEREAFELGIARGVPGDDSGELVERVGMGAGQLPRGASAGHAPTVSREVVDEAVDRASGRRRVRQALRMPWDRRVREGGLDRVLAGDA